MIKKIIPMTLLNLLLLGTANADINLSDFTKGIEVNERIVNSDIINEHFYADASQPRMLFRNNTDKTMDFTIFVDDLVSDNTVYMSCIGDTTTTLKVKPGEGYYECKTNYAAFYSAHKKGFATGTFSIRLKEKSWF